MTPELIADINVVLEKHGWQHRLGDFVEKKEGQSGWSGTVTGIYANGQTAEGYAVTSDHHKNATQIYPAGALSGEVNEKPLTTLTRQSQEYGLYDT